MVDVFHDDGTTVYDFGGSFLVHCPRCGGRAFVHGTLNGPPARLVCDRCGLAKVKEDSGATVGGAYDWFFTLPVWLQVPCAGHVLWAYNLPHVDFLEELVSARLRQRHRPVDTIYVNKRLASRLPKWLLSAKHRGAVLKGLAELRAMAGPNEEKKGKS